MPSPKPSKGGMNPSSADVIEDAKLFTMMSAVCGFTQVAHESGIEDPREIMSAFMTYYA